MTIVNSGQTGAAFQLYDNLVPDLKPRKYAVKANSTLVEDGIFYNSQGNYSYSLHGPNGFVRKFSGNAMVDQDIKFNVDQTLESLTLNQLPESHDYELIDNAYGMNYPDFTGLSQAYTIHLTNGPQNGWYDLILRSKSQNWERRLMGRVEQGHEGITDPAMGVAQFSDDMDIHRDTPEFLRDQPGWWENLDCKNPRTSFKGICKDQCVQKTYDSASFKTYLMNDVLFLQ